MDLGRWFVLPGIVRSGPSRYARSTSPSISPSLRSPMNSTNTIICPLRCRLSWGSGSAPGKPSVSVAYFSNASEKVLAVHLPVAVDPPIATVLAMLPRALSRRSGVTARAATALSASSCTTLSCRAVTSRLNVTFGQNHIPGRSGASRATRSTIEVNPSTAIAPATSLASGTLRVRPLKFAVVLVGGRTVGTTWPPALPCSGSTNSRSRTSTTKPSQSACSSWQKSSSRPDPIERINTSIGNPVSSAASPIEMKAPSADSCRPRVFHPNCAGAYASPR